MFTTFSKKSENSTLIPEFNAFGSYDEAWDYAVNIFQTGLVYGVYIGNEKGEIIWACDGEGCRNF